MNKPLRLLLLPLGAGAIAAAVMLANSHHSTPSRFDPHAAADVFSPQQRDGILRATAAAASSVPADELVAQGRDLFRSNVLAKRAESCQTCHTDGGGTNAALGIIQHPQNATDFTGPRNPISLWNAAKTAPYGWNGGTPTLEAFSVRVIGNFFKAGATQPAETTARQAAALSAYMRSLDPPASDFDLGRLSAAAQRGQALFNGRAQCSTCHVPPLFTDNKNHNILVPQVGNSNDPGSANPPGSFQTPQLRDIGNLAPYMHNGIFATLENVLDFYDSNSSIAPLQLSGPDKADIVAFLRSL